MELYPNSSTRLHGVVLIKYMDNISPLRSDGHINGKSKVVPVLSNVIKHYSMKRSR